VVIDQTQRVKPRPIKVAVVASLVAAALSVVSAVYLVVRADSLAEDARGRDSQISEHAYQVMFDVVAGVVVVVAIVALLAVWALWRRRRWAWWFLVVLSGAGSTTLVRPRSAFAVIESLPAVVVLIALLLPSARQFVERNRTAAAVFDEPAEPWAGQPPTYANSDDWLQGR
jgi:hypothetical protein